MKIFFSAGEPSGDLHGANLIRELRRRQPDVEAVGYGGPEMAAAGCQLHADLTALAVMWLLRVLLNLHKFLDLVSRADRYFRHQRPDAVVLIDYPGFNWWIARRAKAHGIPVFYYAPPQIWAWASWRVRKMRAFVDHVLCSLPFEARWFAAHGCRATFVGHPYFDELRRQTLDAAFLAEHRDAARPLVTLLPGSRTQEVEHNLDHMLRAAKLVQAAVPETRFALACFKPSQAELARERVAASGLAVAIFTRRTPELIELADCCLAVSGSVSLELLYYLKPTVIVYTIGRVGYELQARFRRVKYITLVNLLASDDIFVNAQPAGRRRAGEGPRCGPDAPLFPEYLTYNDQSAAIAGQLITWLRNRGEREQLVSRLAALKSQVAQGGACARAATHILAELARRPQPQLRPHYQSVGELQAPAVLSRAANRRAA